MRYHFLLVLLAVAFNASGATSAKHPGFPKFIEVRIRPLLLKRRYDDALRHVREAIASEKLRGAEADLQALSADIEVISQLWSELEAIIRELRPGNRLQILGNTVCFRSYENNMLAFATGEAEASVRLRDLLPRDIAELVSAHRAEQDEVIYGLALLLVCEADGPADPLVQLAEKLAPGLNVPQHRRLLAASVVLEEEEVSDVEDHKADSGPEIQREVDGNSSAELRDCVIEGKGWRNIVLGAEGATITQILGPPENDNANWLVYRERLGIDMILRDGKVVEIRFNRGFRRPLSSRITIGSPIEHVFAAYEEPIERRQIARNDCLFEHGVLYELPRASKIIYKDRGVLFWFDGKGKVSQFVVFAPATDHTDPPDNISALLNERVSLNRPYPESYQGAPTDKISVQYAVIEVLKQVGASYNWGDSFRNTDPICRRWIRPSIQNLTCEEALREILDPVGLTFQIIRGKVVLTRTTASIKQ